MLIFFELLMNSGCPIKIYHEFLLLLKKYLRKNSEIWHADLCVYC